MTVAPKYGRTACTNHDAISGRIPQIAKWFVPEPFHDNELVGTVARPLLL
jgi:hypothetical protein